MNKIKLISKHFIKELAAVISDEVLPILKTEIMSEIGFSMFLVKSVSIIRSDDFLMRNHVYVNFTMVFTF